MWGVTTYFNPSGYSTKLENLKLFSAAVRRQGLQLCIAELAYPGVPFCVPNKCADLLIRLNAESILWQKERLLNLMLAQLPADCEHVVWLDGDLLFANDSWVEETRHLLGRHKIVQPFQSAVWLPRGAPQKTPDLASLLSRPGIAFALQQPGVSRNVVYRPDLAHPGFAWAARREILAFDGLYDKFILGGGDFLTMLAMYSDSSLVNHPDVSNCFSPKLATDFKFWVDHFHQTVAGDVGYAPGLVLHLWHGDLGNRRYVERYEILRDCDFDPNSDIAAASSGCWQWSSDKPDLHRRVAGYFAARREDG